MVGRLTSGAGLLVPVTALAAGLAYAAALNPVLALAGLGAAVLGSLVVLRPEWLLLVLIAALPWEDALGYPTETVSVVKILGALLLAGYALRALGTPAVLRLPGTAWAVAALCIVVLLSLLAAEDAAAGVGKALRYLLFAAFFALLLQLVRTRRDVHACLRVLVLSLAVAAVVALAAFVQREEPLAAGPIGDPNDFAYFMATVLPLAGYLAIADRGRRWLWAACSLVVIAAMLATLSRGAAVGLAAVVVWALVTRKVPLGGVAAALLAAVVVLAVALTLWQPLIEERFQAKGSVAEQNVDSRQALWRAAIDMAADHPVLGVGPGRFGDESAAYALDQPVGLEDPVAHNSYLEVLAENGLFAFLALLAFVAGSWVLARRALARSEAAGDRDGRRLAIAIQAALVVAAVSACFLSVQLAIPLWLLGGLAAVLAAGDAPHA